MERARAMNKLLLCAAFLSLTASAQAADQLSVMERGNYACGVPGDAAGAAWVRKPGYNFSIETASQYATAKGSGTYLLTGNTLLFTRGPLKDMRFTLGNDKVLRKSGGEGDPRLFCSRVGG